jgi:hypothetical protein
LASYKIIIILFCGGNALNSSCTSTSSESMCPVLFEISVGGMPLFCWKVGNLEDHEFIIIAISIPCNHFLSSKYTTKTSKWLDRRSPRP